MLPSPLRLTELTPDERFRDLARLLAIGLLRLNAPLIGSEPPSHPTTKIPSKSDMNELAVRGTKSVTVHAG